MRKWSPEPFAPESPAAGQAAGTIFRTAVPAGAATPDGGGHESAARFRRETGYTNSRSLMATLTLEERTELYELAEQDVAAGYEQRLRELAADHEAKLLAVRRAFETQYAELARDLAGVVREDLATAAAGAARLALQVAGKIVRAEVAVDHGVLTRAIETVLFRQYSAVPLQIQASPADAAWLAGQFALRERLNIQTVTADRRLEDGGCRVRAGAREWDLTIDGQLDVLTEILEEILVTNRESAAGTDPGSSRGSGLD